jgi:hypothetical protein
MERSEKNEGEEIPLDGPEKLPHSDRLRPKDS